MLGYTITFSEEEICLVNYCMVCLHFSRLLLLRKGDETFKWCMFLSMKDINKAAESVVVNHLVLRRILTKTYFTTQLR